MIRLTALAAIAAAAMLVTVLASRPRQGPPDTRS